MNIRKINRIAKSLLSLNRNDEFRHLRKMLSINSKDTILDVGSGDGFWSTYVAKESNITIGLEPDCEMMEYARNLHARTNLYYLHGTAESIPFADMVFDKIISVSCLEHFENPETAITEMYRVLKPKGELAISVDSLLSENSSHKFREWHSKRHFVNYYFSELELLSVLQKTGFKVNPKQTVHLIKSSIGSYLRQIFIRHPRLWVSLFPVFYLMIRVLDSIAPKRHGQIIIVHAKR